MIEDPTNVHRRDLHLRAIREVVANCLYGADINDMAVEMCKLSLWLVSLDRELPFSFVDDKIFLGNSLIGLTSLDQVRKLHFDPSRVLASNMFEIFDVDIDAIVSKAVDLRRKLATEIDELDPARNSAAKQRQLAELHRITDDLRTIADGVVAVGLAHGGKLGRALEEAYENLRIAVKAAYPESGIPDQTHLDRIVAQGLTPTVPTDYDRWRPLHWIIEAADVLTTKGGFDAIVGNPPFLVGKRISGAIGGAHRDFLVNAVVGGTTGNADLVAYFLSRAVGLLAPGGSLGLVTAKVVSEGSTREVGLDQLIKGGFEIRRAVRSEVWPSKSAATRYAIIWGGFGSSAGQFVLDGVVVPGITTSLEVLERNAGNPLRLAENTNLCFKGYDFGGEGFQLSSDEAAAMIEEDAKNADVLFPFLNGRELNTSPTLTGAGWVLNFGQRTLEESKLYRVPFDRIERLVKPQRLKSNQKNQRERWWVYERPRPELTARLAQMDEVIVLAAVSSHAVPVIVPVGPIFSSAIVIVADPSFGRLAALASSIHLNWVLRWGSLLNLSIRYTTSDVFETFPFPESLERLDSLGIRLHGLRQEIMRHRGIGITALYNLVHDPNLRDAADDEIAAMRSLQVQIDEAMMAAYGWSDLSISHGFHSYRQIERFTVDPSTRAAILGRLLEENHMRAAAEKAAGTMEGRKKRAKGVAGAGEGLF